MKAGKKSADRRPQYVRFIYDGTGKRTSFFRRNSYAVREESTGGFDGLTVTKISSGIERLDDKQLSLLVKCLKEYDLCDATLLADDKMAEMLGITDMLFQARKYEFMHNLTFIMDRLKSRAAGNESMVMVLDSGRWDTGDLFKILTVVKNYYRKIDVITGNDVYNLSRLSEVAYDEWGVILHIYTYNSYPGNNCDMALLFLKNTDRIDTLWKRRLQYNLAYVVADKCRGDGRKAVKGTYSGLVYRAEDEIPYELSVNMAYQKPVVYEKFHVSVIDICEL